MVDFELILARFFDAFLVTIRNLLDFSIEVSIFFFWLCHVPLVLVITTEIVLVLNSAWFSSYNPNQIGQFSFHVPYVLEHFIQQSSFSMKKNFFVCCTGTYTATNSSTAVVCTSMYAVVPRTQQSTAQHSAIPPAQSSKLSTCRSEYVSKEVCTYMHAAPRLFSWSMELLTFPSRLFAPKTLDHQVY